jgi:hypothetical protein
MSRTVVMKRRQMELLRAAVDRMIQKDPEAVGAKYVDLEELKALLGYARHLREFTIEIEDSVEATKPK